MMDPVPPDPAEVERFAVARALVLGRIEQAAARVGRAGVDVTLVAISKTVPPARVRAAVAAGLTILGENRVQEAADKVPAIAGASWHLVGPLQSNKARRAVELFDVVESVDSIELAERLDRLAADLRPGRPLPIFLQVNVDLDPAKAGLLPEATGDVVGRVAGLRNLRLEGLMTIGRLSRSEAEARATFRGLRELSERTRASQPRLGPGLSMGMTDDYPLAVEEGATLVRVGRALFGERPSDEG